MSVLFVAPAAEEQIVVSRPCLFDSSFVTAVCIPIFLSSDGRLGKPCVPYETQPVIQDPVISVKRFGFTVTFLRTLIDLNWYPDAQTLRLGEESEDQEEDDPFSAKLMTFDVSYFPEVVTRRQ